MLATRRAISNHRSIMNILRRFPAIALAPIFFASILSAQQRSPEQNAKSVCIDTHLSLTFDSPPALGSSGKIRLYDSADKNLVDTVDVAIPTNEQSYLIGGFPLHAYPVIIQDKTAVIYPHNN